MPYCFRNADGDELHFIHKGNGLLRSDYGPLRYEEGDYILIPKGTSYQIVPDRLENFSLIIETRGQIEFPDRGNIGHYAPFDYGVVMPRSITGSSKPPNPSPSKTTGGNGSCG
jgi:homogentisate 1,2-dioxygenase